MPAGETVVATESQAALLGTLTQIDIPSNSELVVRDTTTYITLSASVTGAGKLTFSNVKRMNLAGDNFGFTGEFDSDRTCLFVQNAKAFGKGNKVTHHVADNNADGWGTKGFFKFDAGGSYTNEFHFIADGARGYQIYNAASEVKLYGSIHTTGPVEFSGGGSYLRIGCNITHTGGATPKFFNNSYPCPDATLLDFGDEGDLNLVSGAVYLNSGSGLRVNCRNVVVGAQTTWYSMADGTIPATASLVLGSDDVPDGGHIKISGNWFVSNICYRAEINASNVTAMKSTIARPITVRGCGPDFGLYTQFLPDATITLDSKTAEPGTLLLLHPNNTMTGAITAKRGTIAIGADARFTSVTSWNASGDGVIEIRNAASVDSAAAVLTLANSRSGVLRVPKGVNVTFHQLFVNGIKLAPSTYDAVSAPFRMEGEGTVTVADGYVPGNYEAVWYNTTGDCNLYNNDNWSRGLRLDGTMTFNFSAANLKVAEEDTVIVLTNDVVFGGAVFKRNKRLTFRGKTGTERIIMNDCGGMSFMCKDAEGQVYTNVFEVPVVFTPKFGVNRQVSISSNVRVEFRGGLQGGENATTIRMTGSSYGGEISFDGDGALLASPLEVKEMKCGTVTHPRGLGATNRFTTVRKTSDRIFNFRGPGSAVTNETPLRIHVGERWGYNNSSTALDDATTFTGDPAVPFVQMGEVRFVGSSAAALKFFPANYSFLGGISAEGTDPVRFYNHAGYTVNVSGGPMDFSGTSFHSVGNGMTIYNLEEPGARWDSFTLSQMRLVAGAAGVLDPNGALVFCDHDVYPKGILDLNGHDQSALSLRNGDGVTITSSSAGAFGTVDSATPATLTIAPAAAMPAAAVAFTNHVSLVMNGAAESSQTFVHRYSDTDGSLTLNGGTLTFKWGAGWGGTNVTVHAGTLAVGEGSGDVAFGRTAKADLVVDGSGTIDIAEGERAVVGAVTINGVELSRGCWGGPDSGVQSAHRNAALTGRGCLRVTKGLIDGTMLFFR